MSIRATVFLLLVGCLSTLRISASPAIAPANPAFRVASPTTPSVQHSNLAPAEARSSLSGPAITAFRTREGSGIHTDMALTVGYFWRF